MMATPLQLSSTLCNNSICSRSIQWAAATWSDLIYWLNEQSGLGAKYSSFLNGDPHDLEIEWVTPVNKGEEAEDDAFWMGYSHPVEE